MAKKSKYQSFKQFFISFYKGCAHYCYYSRLVLSVKEVYADIEREHGKVTDLVVDQVI
jgi:hypothetical protein